MKKKTVETMLYSAAGVVAMALLLLAVNILAGAVKTRVDLTKEKAYTLSAGTKAILRNLDTPVQIRFYCTKPETASPEAVMLQTYAQRVEDLLTEYKQAAHGKLEVKKLDPQPDSDAEDLARLDGIEGAAMPDGSKVYFGLAVSLLDQKQAIPYLAPEHERLLEYDLSRAISRVVSPDKPVVGIMSPLPVFGMPSNPMMMQMGQQGQEPWALVTELKNDFEVQRVEMDVDTIPEAVKVLVVIHPRDISEKAQYAIDQFVLRGGKLIAFLDPSPMLIDSQKQNPMLAVPNAGSSLDKLLRTWGLNFDTSKVVADMNFKMELGNPPRQAPAVLSLNRDGINQDDIVTSQLDNLWLPLAGAFTGQPPAGLKETVLLKSTKESQLVDSFMANLSGDNVIKDFKPSGIEYALAVRLTGKFKTAFPNGKPEDKKDDADKKADDKKTAAASDTSLKESKQDTTVILVGDADFLSNGASLREYQTPFGLMTQKMNNNLDFAQNAVEQLTGDNNLIAVRSRATQNRPFTVINRMELEAEERYQSRIKELEDSLAETQRQLSELQQKKDSGQRFILSPEQQAAVENYRKKEALVRVQLKDERKKLRQDIDSLENRLEWFNMAAMPLLVSAGGLSLAFYKRKRTAAK